MWKRASLHSSPAAAPRLGRPAGMERLQQAGCYKEPATPAAREVPSSPLYPCSLLDVAIVAGVLAVVAGRAVPVLAQHMLRNLCRGRACVRGTVGMSPGSPSSHTPATAKRGSGSLAPRHPA